jgi:hypothetical protein
MTTKFVPSAGVDARFYPPLIVQDHEWQLAFAMWEWHRELGLPVDDRGPYAPDFPKILVIRHGVERAPG